MYTTSIHPVISGFGMLQTELTYKKYGSTSGCLITPPLPIYLPYESHMLTVRTLRWKQTKIQKIVSNLGFKLRFLIQRPDYFATNPIRLIITQFKFRVAIQRIYTCTWSTLLFWFSWSHVHDALLKLFLFFNSVYVKMFILTFFFNYKVHSPSLILHFCLILGQNLGLGLCWVGAEIFM